MKRTAKSIIIAHCKQGRSIHEIYQKTDLNLRTVRKEYYNYWMNLRENPVKTEVIDGKTVLTIQSKINFEKWE